MKQLLRNISSVYAVNLLNGVLGIIFVPVALYYLGTAGYGLYSIYIVISGYLYLFELGTSKNLQRLLAQEEQEANRTEQLQYTLGIYLLTSFVLLLLSPVILWVTTSYIFPVEQQREYIVGVILILAIIEFIVAIPNKMIYALCIANEKFRSYSLFKVTSGIVRYTLMFAAVTIFKSPMALVSSIVISTIVNIYLSLRMMGGLPQGSWRPKFSWKKMAHILSHSALLSVSQFFQTSSLAIGSILVNTFFGLDKLGVYRAAFDLANKVWFFSNGIGLVIFPKLVKTLNHTKHRLQLVAVLPGIYLISWVLYILIAVVGTLVAPYVLNFIGMTHIESLILFTLLLLGVCLNAHANFSYEILQASGRYWLSVILTSIMGITSVVIFLLLYAQEGVYAIGWAWLLSQAAYAIVSDALTVQSLQISKFKNLKLMIYKCIILIGSSTVIFIHVGDLPNVVGVMISLFLLIILVVSIQKYRRMANR